MGSQVNTTKLAVYFAGHAVKVNGLDDCARSPRLKFEQPHNRHSRLQASMGINSRLFCALCMPVLTPASRRAAKPTAVMAVLTLPRAAAGTAAAHTHPPERQKLQGCPVLF